MRECLWEREKVVGKERENSHSRKEELRRRETASLRRV
jgi:hypothetical protein